MKPFPDHENGNTLAVLKRTLFAVEATSFEQQTLWAQHAEGSLYPHPKFKRLKWEQVTPGWAEQVGRLGNCKIFVEFHWSEIEGQLILFWHGRSAVTDSRQIEAWFKKNFKKQWDGGTRWAFGDAQNFGHCLEAIRQANGTAKD